MPEEKTFVHGNLRIITNGLSTYIYDQAWPDFKIYLQPADQGENGVEVILEDCIQNRWKRLVEDEKIVDHEWVQE
jgi:hypothetical protein